MPSLEQNRSPVTTVHPPLKLMSSLLFGMAKSPMVAHKSAFTDKLALLVSARSSPKVSEFGLKVIRE
jgi:hypothetical protein